jgi:hypothetical protein
MVIKKRTKLTLRYKLPLYVGGEQTYREWTQALWAEFGPNPVDFGINGETFVFTPKPNYNYKDVFDTKHGREYNPAYRGHARELAKLLLQFPDLEKLEYSTTTVYIAFQDRGQPLLTADNGRVRITG